MLRKMLLFGLGIFLTAGTAANVFSADVNLLKKNGDVTIKRTGEMKFTDKLDIGASINNGDTLKTGADGFAALLYQDDKSIVKIRPKTLFTLVAEEDMEGEIRKIRMHEGQIKLDVSGEKNVKYQIVTGTSVASVKGTAFWTTTDGQGNDRFVGVEGTVEIVNTVSGDTVQMTENQTIISTPSGTMMTPTIESDVPADPYPGDVEEGLGEPESGDTAPPAGPVPGDTQPEGGEGGGQFGVSAKAGIGAVTMDGQVYNQISLQPEVSFWKIGVALDLAIYMDQDGNIREEDWNDFGDIIDKIYYVRYGEPGQPLYLRAGAIEDVTLGYGILVSQYSNAIEYPGVRRVGLQYEANFGRYSVTGFANNFREFTTKSGPGLIGTRVSYNPFWKLDVGLTYVVDGNQYLGLDDKDEDGYPDPVDKFPNNKNAVNDTDDDGIADWYTGGPKADEKIWDIDPDGENTVWSGRPGINPNDSRESLINQLGLDPVPFRIGDRFLSHAAAVDIGAPVFSWRYLNLHLFSQFAQILPNGKDSADEISILKNSWGATPLGMRMQIAFVQTQFEYRYFQKYFISDFYNRTYEIDRVTTGLDSQGELAFLTKTERVLNRYDYSQQGYYGRASANLFDIVNVTASYQDMFAGSDRLQSVYGEVGLNTSFIPKIRTANAYIYKSNVEDLLVLRTPSTILGYSFEYEIAGGAALRIGFRETYRDLNGDDEIEPNSNEVVRVTNIETVFSF